MLGKNTRKGGGELGNIGHRQSILSIILFYRRFHARADTNADKRHLLRPFIDDVMEFPFGAVMFAAGSRLSVREYNKRALSFVFQKASLQASCRAINRKTVIVPSGVWRSHFLQNTQ